MASSRKLTHASHKQRLNPRLLGMVLIGAGLIIVAVVSGLLIPGLSDEAASSPKSPASVVPVKVQFPAPQLTLRNLRGENVSLQDFLGQVVLVNNWATWCPPCKAEMPVFQAYYEAHRSQGFVIVAIESGTPVAQVSAFAADYGLSFPVWADVQQVALAAFRNFSLPNSYVIDRDGQVRLAWTGAISREMLEGHVTPLLEE